MPRAIKWPPKDLEEGGTLEVKISAKLSSKNDRWVAADGSEDGARQFALVADIYSPNFDLLLWKSITTKEFDRSESRWVAELS